MIALFTARCPHPPDTPPLPGRVPPTPRFMLLERGIFGCRRVFGGTGSDGREPGPGQLVEYIPGGGRGGHLGTYGYVSGHVLARDRVRAVEALFDNGRVLRDDAPGGVFALFSLDTAGPCALRVIGGDGRVLGRFDLVAESRRLGGMGEQT